MKIYKLLYLFLALQLVGCSGSGDDEGGGTPPPAPPKEIIVDPQSTLFGLISDNNGNAVKDVVVSDGFQCVVTNSDGVYQMVRNVASDMVFYSTPSEYKIEVTTNNYPNFFARIDKSKAKFRQDFKLNKLAAIENTFKLICVGDPQPATTAEVTRFSKETMGDVRKTVIKSTIPCYGLVMGDITGEKPDLLTSVRTAITSSSIPMFSTIGNHDKISSGNASTPRNPEYFKTIIGPLDYSFNRGKVHIVCLDNIRYSNTTDYSGGFTNEQVEWLKQDLSHVSKDKMVILFYHIPLRNGTSGNIPAVKNLIKEYAQAHLMSGHTHYTENHINEPSFNEIYEHIHAGACGAWWRSAINGDGTPNGYAVYDVVDAKITNWYYKASLYEKEVQIRLHKGQDNCTGFVYPYAANVVVANVWNADKYWKVSLYENGVKTANMALTGTTNDSWSVGYHIGVLGRGDNYKTSCKHQYLATMTNPSAKVKVVAEDQWGNIYEQSTFTQPTDYSAAISSTY